MEQNDIDLSSLTLNDLIGTENVADITDIGVAEGIKIEGSYAESGTQVRANDGQVILAGTRAMGESLITGGATSGAKSVVTVPAGQAMDVTAARAYDWMKTATATDTPAAKVDEYGKTTVAGGDVGEVRAPIETISGRIWFDDDNDGLLSETTDADAGTGADTMAEGIEVTLERYYAIVGTDENGHIVTGFFAGRSHRIVACTDCKLQPAWMNELAARACALLEENGITAYNEETHTGRVRHLYMRQGWHSGQRLLCFVVNGNGLPNEAEICATLQKEFALTTILVNRNSERTNVILGRRTRTVLGPGVIEDTLAGVPLRMGVHEFYQVNTPAAEVLYAKAREYAGLKPDDFLLDLYCGMGTIGLSMLADCKRLVGVEVVPQAVEGAKETAARLGLDADRADFRCQDAGAAAAQLAADGARPDVIVVDPPRKGCDEATLTAIAEMAPRTVVMVSCNAATAARDAKWLTEHGYKAVEVQPVDLFPRTKHVECVVKMLLSK